jgi:hypothetical protein
MAKSVSKSEALTAINSTDALQVLLEKIDRNESSSSKQIKLNRLISEIQKQIKDERDILIVSVKAK